MPFASFSCRPALARTSGTILKKMARANILVLFLILGGTSLTLPPLRVNLAASFLYALFIRLRKCSFIPSVLSFFDHERVLVLLNTLSVSIEVDVGFALLLLIRGIALRDFRMVNPPGISGINPPWEGCVVLSLCGWIQFATVSWESPPFWLRRQFSRSPGLRLVFLRCCWRGFASG